MKNYILVFFLFVLTHSALSNEVNEEFEKFIEAFNEKNVGALDKYIDPDYGLFILDNPGAFVFAYHYNSFQDIFKLDYGANVALKVMKINCDYRKGKKPEYSCNDDKWSSEGCFLEIRPEIKLSKFYEYMIEFEIANYDSIKLEYKLSLTAEKKVTHLIYNTNESVGFYFALKNKKLKLIYIDKVTPCDA